MVINTIGLLLFASYHQVKSKLKQETTMAAKNTSARTNVAKATQSKNHFYDNLTSAMMELVEPYIAAVDAVPASREHASADTGHAKPSMGDRNLKFMLGTILSYADRQLNGPIRTKDGKTYDCAIEMMDKNERRLREIEEELETGVDSETKKPITAQASIRLYEEIENRMYYARRNEAWVAILQGIIGAMNTVHDEVYAETWKPNRTEAEATSVFAKADETERQRLNKEYLAKLKAMRAA